MNKERPTPGTPEFDKWILERAQARSDKLFKAPADFEERGVISGNTDAINASDAESFPDELEEYSREERKPQIVNKKDE